jgi:hypothetical protein
MLQFGLRLRSGLIALKLIASAGRAKSKSAALESFDFGYLLTIRIRS